MRVARHPSLNATHLIPVTRPQSSVAIHQPPFTSHRSPANIDLPPLTYYHSFTTIHLLPFTYTIPVLSFTYSVHLLSFTSHPLGSPVLGQKQELVICHCTAQNYLECFWYLRMVVGVEGFQSIKLTDLISSPDLIHPSAITALNHHSNLKLNC